MINHVYTLLVIGLIFSSPTALVGTKKLTNLQRSITELLDQEKFSSMRWGILIATETGEVLFERDADKAFVPASTIKLLTSATALDQLGADFKIRTSVYATQPVRNGVLSGNLIVYGRGDPMLSSRYTRDYPYRYFEPFIYPERNSSIEYLADQIKDQGIKRITGTIIGDDSFFSTKMYGPGWEWDDAHTPYAAQISALTVNDNCVSCTMRAATQVGEAAMVEITPRTGYVTIKNSVAATQGGQAAVSVHRPPESNTIELYGKLPVGAQAISMLIPIHDPARFAATLLKEALRRRGIRISDTSVQGERLDKTRMPEIAYIESPALSRMLTIMNKMSQNLYAELLLRVIGVARGTPSFDSYGRPQLSESLGNEVRCSFLQAAGIDLQAIKLHDGSGLARHNLLTPRTVVRLLQHMASHLQSALFKDSLSIASEDGTLEKRMEGMTGLCKIKAKTGTLGAVNALSGYMTTTKGQSLIFSFMANNYTGQPRDVLTIFDRICTLIAEHTA